MTNTLKYNELLWLIEYLPDTGYRVECFTPRPLDNPTEILLLSPFPDEVGGAQRYEVT